jgi:hypothetical protein
VAIQPEKSDQPIHRASLSDIMSAPQTIVGAPVHVFRLIRKFFKHVRAPSQLHPAVVLMPRIRQRPRSRQSLLVGVVNNSGLSANRAGVLNAQSWRLIIVWLEV